MGKWTDELEAENQSLLEKNLKFEEAWDAAVAEAADTGVSAKEWGDFWMEKRAEVVAEIGKII